MSQEEFDSRMDAGEDPYGIVADDFRRSGVMVEPHDFQARGWRFWICDHCFAPRGLHPRKGWSRARPMGHNYYISPDAPHFREGW